MFIKRISIQGFKTFKNHVVIENFSPNENIIIGSNGSGKSNLFAAIKFAISEDYHNLTTEDRLSLIYQGAGTVMSCFVELEFDNGTTIRRTIGLKKDEFSVDGRIKGKNEVKNVLQTLGFPSGSNNYYIVPQGRITSLTNAKDVERLNLLKEVTGANVFEEKLNKSLRDMEENKIKRGRIDSELQELDTRLEDLNEEKTQLVQCQLLEKEKKLLQYSIFDKNLSEINESGNNLQIQYDENIFESQDLMQQLEESENTITKYKKNLKNLKRELNLKDSLDTNELSDLQVEIADLEAKQELLKSRIEKVSASKNEFNTLKQELTYKLEHNIENINLLQPDYKLYTSKQQELQKKIDSLTQRQTYLITKQGTYSKFESQDEKNKWVKNQISALEAEKQEVLKNIENLKINLTKEQIDNLNQEIEADETKLIEELGSQKESLDEDLAILQDEYYEIVDKRTDCWRQEQTTKTLEEQIQQELDSLNRKLNESMDRPTAMGLSNLPMVIQDLNLSSEQVVGKVGDLIKFSDKYKQCIETTAGNALFNVIVDTDETASRIMGEMADKKLGRITFMPLNRIGKFADINYPGNEDGEFIPLIKKIQFNKELDNCMKLIFAKTVVVKELNTGVSLAKKYGLNAVTPDGDRVDGRGALTGGFNDVFGKNGGKNSTNRLDCLINLREKKEELKEVESDLNKIEEELKQFDSEADAMNEQIQDITLQKLDIKEQETLIKKDQLQRRSEVSNLESQLLQLTESSANLEQSISSLQVQIDILQKDLEQPFDKQLSDEETAELNELIQSLQKATQDLQEIDQEFNEKEMVIETTRHENEFNLKPQLNQLTEQELEDEQKLASYEKKLAIVNKKLKNKQEKEKRVKKEIELSNKEVASLLKQKDSENESLQEIYEDQKATLDKLEDLQTKAERLMTQITKINKRRDVLTNKIVELGFIPEDSLVKFAKLSEDELVEKLKEVTVKLSKFTNVNKRAGESFARFLTKKEDLENKAEELRVSEESIETLIDSLKEQKIEAIETTFQKVAFFFKEIFNKIVPKGNGELIINKKAKSDNGTNTDDIYEGVAIQVSFNSKYNEQLFVDQLSGGQKTVCAIALILAIQRVDPAPFYLFDEVDAALDKEFRTSIANVIHDLSHEDENANRGSQFICTTFRRELLNQADKYLRVRFENKNSIIEEVSKMDAIQFVRGEKRQRISEV